MDVPPVKHRHVYVDMPRFKAPLMSIDREMNARVRMERCGPSLVFGGARAAKKEEGEGKKPEEPKKVRDV